MPYASDSTQANYASSAAYASSKAAKAASSYTDAKDEELRTTAEAKHAKAMSVAYASESLGSKEATRLPNSEAVKTELATQLAYAAAVIPAGGQLLQMYKSSGTYNSGRTADVVPTEDAMKKAGDSIKKDKATLVKKKADAEVAVSETQKAQDTNVDAANRFNTAEKKNEEKLNSARLHAGKAALDMSKVSAVDSYVATHRGAKHESTCAEEKKFSFDVCFGRAEYKGQLLQTAKAKEARRAADKYKKIMGLEYAAVVETKTTLIDVEKTQQKLAADQEKLVDGLAAIAQEKANKAQQ